MKTCTMYVAAALALATGSTAALGSITPVNWWRFDDVGSPTATDSVGGANGTLTGPGVMIPGGVAGGSLDLRNGGWADMGNILPNTAGDFSMSVWINTLDASSASTIIAGRHITGTFNGYMMRMNLDAGGYGVPGRASFYQSNSPANTAVGGPVLSDGAWHHLAASYQAGVALTLYVDGGVAASIGTTAIIGNTANFMVGGVYYSPTSTVISTFFGQIDDLQMYDRALTPGEVTFLRDNPGVAVPAPGAGALLAGVVLVGSRRRR